LCVGQPGLELDRAALTSRRLGKDAVPGALISAVADRDLGTENEFAADDQRQCREHARTCRVADRVGTFEGADPEVQSDDGTKPRSREDVGPRGQAALDPAELACRDAGRSRDLGEREPGGKPCGTKFGPHVLEQAAAPAGSSRRMGFGHDGRMAADTHPTLYRRIPSHA
jgi:hypothetical protein